MKFTKYEGSIPNVKGKKDYKDLKAFFNEFMSANIEIAIVEWNERDYKSANIEYQVLRDAAKRHGFPITVMKRGDSIYFVRRDM